MDYYLYNTTASTISITESNVFIQANENRCVSLQDINRGIYIEGGTLESLLDSGDIILTTESITPPITQYSVSIAKKILSAELWDEEIKHNNDISELPAINVYQAINELTNMNFPSFVIANDGSLVLTIDGGFVFHEE